MKKINTFLLALLVGAPLLFTSCGDDDKDPDPEPETGYTVPSTYEFKDADGNSTVDYSGQTERLNMLEKMTSLMKTGNTSGVEVNAATLKLMFANDESYVWGDTQLDASTKDIKSKTLNASTFETYMDKLEAASKSAVSGDQGVAGVLTSKDGKNASYLVDENGIEYTQLIEKGLMAKTFFNQIVNSYLTESKIGAGVDNTTLEDGKTYTTKAHHFDEAFGYFGAPVGFPTTEGRFIAKYSNTVDGRLGTNKLIMDAYLKGRAAIANNDENSLNEAVEVLYKQLELVFAGSAIHYLNATVANSGDAALRSHALSEAWAFMGGMTVSPFAKVSPTELQAMYDKIGTDFWNIIPSKLNEVRSEIATKYGISDEDSRAL